MDEVAKNRNFSKIIHYIKKMSHRFEDVTLYPSPILSKYKILIKEETFAGPWQRIAQYFNHFTCY